MRIFDTRVQVLKHKVLSEVARSLWNDTLAEDLLDIPTKIIPGNEPTMRCCVYKERAIVNERIKVALGGNKSNPNIIEVIEIACDECPVSGYEVTDFCRGCLAHCCETACKFGAITYDEHHRATIDKSKCVNCGACAKVCPYHAIISRTRPCESACKVNAIRSQENNSAFIDAHKCIECGACAYQCPFGAINDKSFIKDTISIIKNSNNNEKYKTYAIVAPSISSQFSYAKLGQVVTGLKELGFHSVVEVALGADLVALDEAKELAEKRFLTSSCCPAFVKYVKQSFPKLADNISTNLSPMGRIAQHLKEKDPTSKIVFIGPCTSKKGEIKLDTVKKYVDNVITFEELQALFDSRDIDITALEEDKLEGASYYGRIFARSGGLTDAVSQAVREQNIDFELKPIACDGIEQCKLALTKANRNMLDANFVEGMACLGGCIGGAGCLTHGPRDKTTVEKYGMEAKDKTMLEAANI